LRAALVQSEGIAMKYMMTLAGAAAALAAGAGAAHAGCVYPGKLDPGSVHMIPGFLTSHLSPPAAASTQASGAASAAANIVGTWLVTYTSGGQPFGQAFIQWHGDRTEWENINLPLAGGNICVGSWKMVDNQHVARLHYGWLYTNGILTGYFTETETDMVNGHDQYSGVNVTTIYDLQGNVHANVPGTSSAVRIAP
jgi:hypothetical protein